MSVPMAIALSGQPLPGQAVMVKPSEAEKNLVQSNVTSGGAASVSPVSSGFSLVVPMNMKPVYFEECTLFPS